MPPEVQQAIVNFLGALALIITAVGAVFAAYYRVQSNASADSSKKQGEAAETHGQALDNAAAALLILARSDEKHTSDIGQLADNQARNIKSHEATVEIMKSLNDRNTLLEDLVTRLNQALILNTAALAENAKTNTHLIELQMASSRQFGDAMTRMQGAGTGIILELKTEIGDQATDLRGRLLTVGTDVSETRALIEGISQRVDNLMTETALKELIAQLEELATAVTDIKPVVVSFLAQITTLQTITDLEADKKALADANEQLAAEIAALKAKYEPPTVDPLAAPDQPPTEPPAAGTTGSSR